jgi:hypothetical protein
VNVLPDAQITLSTGDVGSTENWAIHPTIISVTRAFDEDSPHHVEIFC